MQMLLRVLRSTNSFGHTETGPPFKASSERLEKPAFESTAIVPLPLYSHDAMGASEYAKVIVM